MPGIVRKGETSPQCQGGENMTHRVRRGEHAFVMLG